MAGEMGSRPWLDGHYTAVGTLEAVVVEGERVTNDQYPDIVMAFKHGVFGEADEDIAKLTGEKKYNVEAKYNAFGMDVVEHGVVWEDGRKITMKTMMGVWSLEWMTPEEAERQANDGDPIAAPPSHYTLEPERQGKLVWITGAPGLGKSTTAQLLARHHGFVFYEGDCFFTARNPYIHPDVGNPSMAQTEQRKLIGPEAKTRRNLASVGDKAFEGLVRGEEYDPTAMEPSFALLCADIKKERARMGGDWAVAAVLVNRKIRDFVRSQFGPELQIVVLDMALEDQMERVRARHGGDQSAVEMCKATCPLCGNLLDWSLQAVHSVCEPAGEDEPGTFDLKVNADMTQEDVVNKLLQMAG